MTVHTAPAPASEDLPALRRRLLVDAMGIAVVPLSQLRTQEHQFDQATGEVLAGDPAA